MSPSRSARASHAAAVPKSAAPRRRVSVKLYSWTSLRWSRTVRSPLRLASRVCEVPPRSACDGVAARALTCHLVALALASQLVRPNLLLPSFQSIVHTDARNTFLCDSYELATPHQRLCPKSNFSFVLRLGGCLLALRISAYMSLQQECLLWLLLRTPLAKAPGASFMEPALF